MSRFQPLAFFLLACLSVACYLGASYIGGFIGFPLDDAWIHQTYARNLATLHQFAFVPGQPSAGSTSPLWTGLLSIGYLLQIPHLVWTYILGTTLLGLNAWLVYRLVLKLWPERATVALLAGIATALEWHLIWGAVSGMETLLFSALALVVFVIPAQFPGRLGLWAGLSILARPDGLTLLPFALARLALLHIENSPTFKFHASRFTLSVLRFILSFCAVFLPYLAFNYWLSGAPWPNTFYAKQTEYATLQQWPLLQRLWQMGLQPFIGAQALLVPGLVIAAWKKNGQRGETWVSLLWAGTFLAAYALRLPATYQHGRYLMPIIPLLLAVGLGGSAEWLRLRAPGRWSALRLVSRVWTAAAALLLLVFWGLGSKIYMQDVQIINSEMVATAKWINANTPPNTLIAAHDIGALGYFGQRRILDLAGLISPEVVPFMHDEARLQTWLTASGANYLVTAPGWPYSGLVKSLAAARVFTTQAPYAPAAGGENMAVYQLAPPN